MEELAAQGEGRTEKKRFMGGRCLLRARKGVALFFLLKCPIAIAVGTCAFAGHAFYGGAFFGRGRLFFMGVGLFAMAGGLLNNLQDRNLDERFERTRWRKAVIGDVGTERLFLVVAGLFFGGLIAMATADSLAALFLALLGLVVYNGIYTPLKWRSFWAVIPGSLCGVAAFAAGWVGAGGGF